LPQAHPPGLVHRSPRLPTCPPLALAAHSAARARCARPMPPHSHQLRRRTWCERACMTRTAARNSAFTKPVPQSAPCAHRVCPCSPASPTPRSHTLPGHPSFRPHHQFVASHVRPNPSLSRDPTRQAAWASWRAGLCCSTPPKRLAARVAVSSNVGPRRLPPQTADIAGACLPPYPPALARPSTLTPASGASGRFRGIRGQGASPP
jgi:hypothetical protein